MTTRKSKTAKTEKRDINEIVSLYQETSREVKKLEAVLKPLKERIVEYAKAHKADFDEAFQLKFENGTYVSLRVSDVLDGSKSAKEQLLLETGDNFSEVKLDERAVVLAVADNDHLRKLLTKLGIVVAQKETFAVYAG